MKQFLKIALGGACALALVMTFAIGRTTPPPAPVVAADPPGFAETWNDSVKVVELKTADMKHAYRQIDLSKTQEITTERITPDAPAKVPPIIPHITVAKVQPVESKPERNICTRHRMQKVWVSKYKWRCKK
ncbi:MAG TPA: hypothetical protein VFP43_22520 [Mesorhizobium sp.]|nr:hypothetical protein [Mesorhizobium sp.]